MKANEDNAKEGNDDDGGDDENGNALTLLMIRRLGEPPLGTRKIITMIIETYHFSSRNTLRVLISNVKAVVLYGSTVRFVNPHYVVSCKSSTTADSGTS